VAQKLNLLIMVRSLSNLTLKLIPESRIKNYN
jgi:hypothetical protein